MLQRYKCHKEVEAIKIDFVEHIHDGTAAIYTANGPIIVDAETAKRFKGGPDSGYYVRYADGYESWSPTKAFEEGYTKIE